MLLPMIMNLENPIQGKFLETLELSITFLSLYGIIFYLLITAENKKIFRNRNKILKKFLFSNKEAFYCNQIFGYNFF